VKHIEIDSKELKFTFIRTPGPGGQNVNKVSTGVVLRFNVVDSPSLPETVRQRLLTRIAAKLTLSGDVLIKACRYRTQNRNKQDALERLDAMIKEAQIVPKKRKKSKPTLASKKRRLESKALHSKKKATRGRPAKDHD
jgi:ribosome-associated protein